MAHCCLSGELGASDHTAAVISATMSISTVSLASRPAAFTHARAARPVRSRLATRVMASTFHNFTAKTLDGKEKSLVLSYHTSVVTGPEGVKPLYSCAAKDAADFASTTSTLVVCRLSMQEAQANCLLAAVRLIAVHLAVQVAFCCPARCTTPTRVVV